MRCRFCGKKISSSDPTYSNGFHYECNKKVLKELESLGIVKVLLIEGTKVSYQFPEAFYDVLLKALEDARIYIIPDQTVDDDFITFSAVIRAVIDYLPKNMPKSKALLCSEMVFNTLMTQQYGSPLPLCKRFGSRAEEYAKEIHSIPISAEVATELKQFKKIRWL
jgi:hypothetical protein